MAATTIGNTAGTTIISDNATPGNGTYAWYITTLSQGGSEPMAPVVNWDFAAEVNVKEKYFDTSAVYRINDVHITSSTDMTNLRKAFAVWEAGDTLLYLSVKNTWASELAIRGTKAVPATIDKQYQGKLFNFRWQPRAAEVIVGIEFHYTTA